MDLKKGILFKKIRNHSQSLKLQQHITILHKFTKQGKLHMLLEIPSCLGYGPQSINVYGFDAPAKINNFFQLALLSNNLVLMSYLVVFI